MILHSNLNDSLYVFGGVGYNGYLNDLWRFDFKSMSWIYLSGNNTININGVYSTTNGLIGSRYYHAMVYNTYNDSIIIMGGRGLDSFVNYGALNDVWMIPLSNICPPNIFGVYCNQSCLCLNGTCYDDIFGDGSCSSCNVGYYGVFCNNSCSCVSGNCSDGISGNGSCSSSSTTSTSSISSITISSSTSSTLTSSFISTSSLTSSSSNFLTSSSDVNIITNTKIENNSNFTANNLNIFSNTQFIFSTISVQGSFYSNNSILSFDNSIVMIGTLTLNSTTLNIDLYSNITVTNCISLNNISIVIDFKNENTKSLSKNIITFPQNCKTFSQVSFSVINDQKNCKYQLNVETLVISIKECSNGSLRRIEELKMIIMMIVILLCFI